MSNNPLNLVLRFLLEIGLLVALSYWGWNRHEGIWRYVLVIGLPVTAGIVWGTFRVPGDDSASGEARVPISGRVRLPLELALFGFGTWCLFGAEANAGGTIFAALVVIHYLLSYDRVAWLLKAAQ